MIWRRFFHFVGLHHKNALNFVISSILPHKASVDRRQRDIWEYVMIIWSLQPGITSTHRLDYLWRVDWRVVLFSDSRSQKGHSVSCIAILFYAYKSPDQTSGHTYMGCQPGDCRLPVNFCCVDRYGLKYSFYHPEGGLILNNQIYLLFISYVKTYFVFSLWSPCMVGYMYVIIPNS